MHHQKTLQLLQISQIGSQIVPALRIMPALKARESRPRTRSDRQVSIKYYLKADRRTLLTSPFSARKGRGHKYKKTRTYGISSLWGAKRRGNVRLKSAGFISETQPRLSGGPICPWWMWSGRKMMMPTLSANRISLHNETTDITSLKR